MPYSVIIPSKTLANLVPCVRAIREAGETCRIIVVDDGLVPPGNSRPADDIAFDHWGEANNLDFAWGVKPFVFARNVNVGINVAGADDVILLNDDALLKTPMGFAALAHLAQMYPDGGLIAASCDTVGNPNQFRRQDSTLPRPEPRMVCFVCVYIPRSTIRTVGLLDERFGGIDDLGREIYGFCDDDYCFRVRQAGLKLGIFDGCFVDHSSLESSFRSGVPPRSLEPGQRQFILKHGVDNHMQPRETSSWRHLFQ